MSDEARDAIIEHIKNIDETIYDEGVMGRNVIEKWEKVRELMIKKFNITNKEIE